MKSTTTPDRDVGFSDSSAFRWWYEDMKRALKAPVKFYEYQFGWLAKHSARLPRTKARLVFCEPRCVTVIKWMPPVVFADVGCGMSEHYGGPRHHLLLVIWWKRRGYVSGVEFYAPNDKITNLRA